jgi:hypothetical protein
MGIACTDREPQTSTGDHSGSFGVVDGAASQHKVSWSLKLQVDSEQWCVSELTVGAIKAPLPGESKCSQLPAHNGRDNVAVPFGDTPEGAVYGVYAPGLRVAGSSLGESSGSSATISLSESPPLLLALLNPPEQAGSITLRTDAGNDLTVTIQPASLG